MFVVLIARIGKSSAVAHTDRLFSIQKFWEMYFTVIGETQSGFLQSGIPWLSPFNTKLVAKRLNWVLNGEGIAQMAEISKLTRVRKPRPLIDFLR
jgi:hypothetical protein